MSFDIIYIKYNNANLQKQFPVYTFPERLNRAGLNIGVLFI